MYLRDFLTAAGTKWPLPSRSIFHQHFHATTAVTVLRARACMGHEYSCFWQQRRRWHQSRKEAPLSPSLSPGPISSHRPSSIPTHYARSTPSDAHIFPHSGFHKVTRKRFRGTIFLNITRPCVDTFKGPCSAHISAFRTLEEESCARARDRTYENFKPPSFSREKYVLIHA